MSLNINIRMILFLYLKIGVIFLAKNISDICLFDIYVILNKRKIQFYSLENKYICFII